MYMRQLVLEAACKSYFDGERSQTCWFYCIESQWAKMTVKNGIVTCQTELEKYNMLYLLPKLLQCAPLSSL